MKITKKKLFLFGFFSAMIFIFLPNFWILKNSKGKNIKTFEIDFYEIGIVFGAGIYNNSFPSDIFADRLKTAAQLFKNRKINKILISGGNPNFDHNEPFVGKNFLIDLGIPEEKIFLDFAGYRTFDTCARAKKIFSIDKAILITQSFHLPRAIFLCEKMGIKSAGAPADLQTYQYQTKNNIREILARAASFWEINIFRHDPKFLGEKIPI